MSDGLWRRVDRDGCPELDVVVDGRTVRAFGDESVATLLLRLGHTHVGRHPANGGPLAPWCLMGTCFGCLCTIDGRPGTQACLVPVVQGLEILTDAGAPAPARLPEIDAPERAP